MKNFELIDQKQLILSSEEQMPRDDYLEQHSKIDQNQESYRNNN